MKDQSMQYNVHITILVYYCEAFARIQFQGMLRKRKCSYPTALRWLEEIVVRTTYAGAEEILRRDTIPASTLKSCLEGNRKSE